MNTNTSKLKKMKKITAIILVNFIVISMAIATASSTVVNVGDYDIEDVGLSTTVDVTLNEAPYGLAEYNLIISLSHPDVAEIVSVSFPSWATSNSHSTLPADAVWIEASDPGGQVEIGATDINLATLTLRGDDIGETDIHITVSTMKDDGGYSINPDTDYGRLVVGEYPPPDPYPFIYVDPYDPTTWPPGFNPMDPDTWPDPDDSVYNFDPLDPGWWELYPDFPVPELQTFILLSTGIIIFAGYVTAGRRGKGGVEK